MCHLLPLQAVVSIPSNFVVIVGLLADCLPIRGRRCKYYVALGRLLWLITYVRLATSTSQSYSSILWCVTRRARVAALGRARRERERLEMKLGPGRARGACAGRALRVDVWLVCPALALCSRTYGRGIAPHWNARRELS